MDEVRRTVLADEITVEKRAERSQFKMPAVILEIASTADRSMMVSVTEPIPESFPMKNIGFHPDYGGEHWSISTQEIVFAREIDPGDEYTTVYGVRNIGDEDIETFVDAETSVSTGEKVPTGGNIGNTGGDPVSALLTEDDGEIVRNVISGDDDSLSTLENADSEDPEPNQQDAEPDPDQQDAEPDPDQQDSESDPDQQDSEPDPDQQDSEPDPDQQDSEPDPDQQDSEPDPDQQDSEDTNVSEEGKSAEHQRPPGSVAEALAGEIRDGTISEEHERVLREAFSESTGTQRDVDIRIKRLQTEVSDLAAYVDEFERLLGEYKGGEGPFASLESALASVTDRVEELENDVHAVDGRLANVESELDALQEGLDGDQSEDIDVLRERLENVEAELEDALYFEGEVMELDDRIKDVQQLQERVETLKTEMAKLNAFHDRLSSAFGLDDDRFEEQEE